VRRCESGSGTGGFSGGEGGGFSSPPPPPSGTEATEEVGIDILKWNLCINKIFFKEVLLYI